MLRLKYVKDVGLEIPYTTNIPKSRESTQKVGNLHSSKDTQPSRETGTSWVHQKARLYPFKCPPNSYDPHES